MTRIRIGETQINGTKMLKSDGTTLTPVKYGYQGVRTRSELLDGGKKKKKKVKIFYNPDGCPMSACVKKGDELKFHLGAIKKGIVNQPPTFLSFYNLVSTTEINQISRHYIIYFLKLRICMWRGSFLKFSWE